LPVSRRRRGRAATRSARSGNLPITNRRKKTNKFYLAASLVIAVLVIASFAFASFSGGRGSTQIGSAQSYVDGVGTEVPILTADHIAEGSLATYNSQPPTSGDHWITPAVCGFYEEGLPDERVVHNMEHGNIVVSYNLPLESDVAALRDAIGSIGLANVWGVTRAYEGIPTGEIGLSAWGVVDNFMGVDRDRIERFFEAYSGALGPELVPC
tara:strand:- start:470 stop:1102 length:633 start_codon:yes stop_codon:yes gene_type:complete